MNQMSRYTRGAALCALAWAWPALAFAQPQALTLKQALDQAWMRQPQAQAIDLRREATTAQRRAAAAWTPAPPALELELKTDQIGSRRGGRELTAGASVPLWLPGERARSQAVAAAESDVLDSRQAAALWATAGTLREAWWAVQIATVDVAVAQGRSASLRLLSEDVARRTRAGDLARADQHQAEAALAAAQADEALARATQTQARQALRALLGVALPDSLNDSAEPLPASTPQPPHPLLRELTHKLQLAQRARELAAVQTRAHPELTLSGTRERGGYGESYGQGVTVGLRLPFGNDDAQRARAALTAADAVEAQALLQSETERIAAETTAAAARVDATRAAATASDTRATLLRETRGFYDKSFRLGQTDLPTRLRVEAESAEAERQAARARFALAQAISSWRQALGLLPE